MKLKIPFEIGDWVEFVAVVKSGRRKGDKGQIVKYFNRNECRERRTGRVVGVVRRHEGYSDRWDLGEQRQFTPTLSKVLVKVAETWFSKPMECYFEDVKIIDPPESGGFPMATRHEWSDEYKDIMREERKDWPRDDKGRWVKADAPTS